MMTISLNHLSVHGNQKYSLLGLIFWILFIPACDNGRLLYVFITDTPSETRIIKLKATLGTASRTFDLSKEEAESGQFAIHFNGESSGIARLDVAAYSDKCSIAAGSGSTFLVPNAAISSAVVELKNCQQCWCSYRDFPGTELGQVNLQSIWGASSDDIWAVGKAGIALHWDGSHWTRRESGTTAQLRSVYGLASNDVWITGSDYDAQVTMQTFGAIKHWDGSSLSNVYDVKVMYYGVLPGSNGHDLLYGGCGTSNCSYLTKKSRDGFFSENEILPNMYISLIADVKRQEDPDSYIAVGGAGKNQGGPLDRCPSSGNYGVILRKNGTQASWQADHLPDFPQTCNLWSTWNANPNDIWAVGEYGSVLHWDGMNWTSFRDSLPTKRSLWSVWGNHSTDVWAVGGSGSPTQGVIIHWNGKTWESSLTRDDILFGVWGSSEMDMWAVGNNGSLLRYRKL